MTGLDPTLSGTSGIPDQTEVNLLSDTLKFLFSWVALMPIAVIISGKLLVHVPAFKLSGQEHQRFGIRLPGVIHLVAEGDEVVLGFLVFILVLFSLAITSGHGVYTLFRDRFGIDLGQFNSLCVFSAFCEVILTGAVLLLVIIVGVVRRRADPVITEYNNVMEDLTRGS